MLGKSVNIYIPPDTVIYNSQKITDKDKKLIQKY